MISRNGGENKKSGRRNRGVTIGQQDLNAKGLKFW